MAAAIALQTFKPHKEKQGLTKAVSPELRTKKRALTVCSADPHQLVDIAAGLVALSRLWWQACSDSFGRKLQWSVLFKMCALRVSCCLPVHRAPQPRLDSRETGPTRAATRSSSTAATGEHRLTACLTHSLYQQQQQQQPT